MRRFYSGVFILFALLSIVISCGILLGVSFVNSVKQIVEDVLVLRPLPTAGATPITYLTNTFLADWELLNRAGDELVAGTITFEGGSPAHFRLAYWSKDDRSEVIYVDDQLFVMPSDNYIPSEELNWITTYILPMMSNASQLDALLHQIGISELSDHTQLNYSLGEFRLIEAQLSVRPIDKQVTEIIIALEYNNTQYTLHIYIYGYNVPIQIVPPLERSSS